jgi:hypothetical protein
MPEFNPPNANNPVIDEQGKMEQQFRTWTINVTNESTIVGTGSPEGVIEASQYREYIDSSGSTGTIKYIKMLADIGGDTSQGWTLI